MPKITITHDEKISPQSALSMVRNVVDAGLISNGRYGEQYCFVTTFNRLGNDDELTVYASKTKNGTHTFRIF